MVAANIVTELDIGYSARSTAHYRANRRAIVNRLIPVTMAGHDDRDVFALTGGVRTFELGEVLGHARVLVFDLGAESAKVAGRIQ